ncbi:sugar phosphate nucleotidyltransferase [Paenibacillus planticolens]|uniref:Glucose-1-phosphate thymidylyltransferase n=1 Tax=Paenibacillus planticolens TaxID=2654976 RepID=A0ABX1ZW86_9BACL|nr:sugar phosphate nucleotidyltransferase [Paenibacillus planticolens]NOV04247.1 NTP transferase domain-containing protein [Paenibacillus planticolens]
MKGVILAGGTGTRLRPLTKMINKHLLPVGKYPMIYYGIEKLRAAGITDILLITGKHSVSLYTDFLGSGKEWGVNISYKIQEEAGGIADALELAENFVHPGEKLLVLLGDNLFEDSLVPYVNQFEAQPEGAKVFLKEVEDARRYGVPVMDGELIKRIEEKPEHPQSSYCVTGIYMYDSTVFDLIKTVEPSARGEMEITDVNNLYAEQGKLSYHLLTGWWFDAGTFLSWFEASDKLREYPNLQAPAKPDAGDDT